MNYTLVNVYAPTQIKIREGFFKNLQHTLITSDVKEIDSESNIKWRLELCSKMCIMMFKVPEVNL